MKKEEFLTKLRKNLSVLEEKEIQDIVEEYEQHIDMKMKGGLSEEDAIRDFGDLAELTAGILEAYHVKANYNSEKKNIDFEKVKEESRKATEKATSAIGKGAETAGKWGARQAKKLWNTLKKPYSRLKEGVGINRNKAKGSGIWGKFWTLVLGLINMLWRIVMWSVRLFWNLFWLCFGIMSGFCTLGCIFLFGALIVLLVMGYPFAGATMVMIGSGMTSTAMTLFCFSLIQKKRKKDTQDVTKDSDESGSHTGDSEVAEEDWEYPKETKMKKIMVINAGEEVLNHA